MTAAIDWDELKRLASEVRANAHAPYSQFRVGAALQAGGKTFVGCNVENASYPVGLCAERGALAAAIAAGCRELEALVIAADRPITPCGMCRQALSEFAAKLPIVMISDSMEAQATLSQIFPDPFELR
jgi:cytidine deaminase